MGWLPDSPLRYCARYRSRGERQRLWRCGVGLGDVWSRNGRRAREEFHRGIEVDVIPVAAKFAKCAQTLHSGDHGHAQLCRRLHFMAVGRAKRISSGSDRVILLGVLAFALVILTIPIGRAPIWE